MLSDIVPPEKRTSVFLLLTPDSHPGDAGTHTRILLHVTRRLAPAYIGFGNSASRHLPRSCLTGDTPHAPSVTSPG